MAPLLATIEGSGLAMDHAKVEWEVKLDPFSYRPTFQLALRVLSLDVTKINELSRAYGSDQRGALPRSRIRNRGTRW